MIYLYLYLTGYLISVMCSLYSRYNRPDMMDTIGYCYFSLFWPLILLVYVVRAASIGIRKLGKKENP